MRSETWKSANRQGGAALLLLVLVLILVFTHALIAGLNEHGNRRARLVRSVTALEQARLGLIAYAVNYPELRPGSRKGPGFLPCPDHSGNGNPAANCSVTTGTTLGRLPFRILGVGDLRDADGERLWYAVSQGFRNTRPDASVINSDTPGELVLDDSDDVVAVILAPGPALKGQAGRPGNTASDYLDCGNASGLTTGFRSHCAGNQAACTVGISSLCFNDVAVFITRRELMAAVEQRVAAEVRAALSRYRDHYGAYPWLAPFSDPRASSYWLKGRHSGPDGSSSLRDTTADFPAQGVTAGDRVWNLDDGSTGLVSVVHRRQLDFHAGMALGDDRRFDRNDVYVVVPRKPAIHEAGSAAAGSGALLLRDGDRDFAALGVVPGDVVDNLDDGSSGVIAAADRKWIRVRALSGGAYNHFRPGQRYRLRSNGGIVTSSDARRLVDENADFLRMGVRQGDLVSNVNDESFVLVGPAAPSAGRLDVEPIATGNGNHFAAGDGYRISRFDGVVGTRAGMLPLHLPGEAFTTGFSFSWSLPVSENNIVSVGGDDLSPAYAAAMARRLQSSDLQGTVRVDAVRGSCLWIAPQFADCRGMSVDTAHARFTARLVRHDGYVAVTDDDTDFPALGVRVGDRVFNLARAAAGLVVEARPDSPHTIRIGNRPGHGEFTAVAGDLLRLQVAAREYVNRAEPGTIAGNSVCVPGADLSFLAAGDSVVNLSDPGAVGEVMERHAEAGRDCFRYTLLRGGTMPRITAGQYFKLLYDFVDSRRYTFVIRMRGEFVTANDTGIRRRSVCVGYPPGCSGQPVPAVLAADTALPVVTIDDYDAAGRRLGGGSLTIPATDVSPAPRGSMLVADMNLALSVEGGDLPDWFTRQRWHQYIFAAHGDGLGPGESNACDGVGVCFVAARRSPGAGTRTGVELVVLSAGTDLAHQDRARAVIDAYLEGGIALYDDHVFSYGPVSVRFNDRISMTPQ